MKKNGFLTFITACVPGFGQMYYGYMRRGVSLGLWFWGLVFIVSLSGLGELSVLLFIIWGYAFFDTFNIRMLTYEQRLAFPDEFIPNRSWIKGGSPDGGFRKTGVGRVLGIILIVIGLLILYRTAMDRLIGFEIWEYHPVLATFLEMIPAIVIAVLIIWGGIWMLRRPGTRAAQDENDPMEFHARDLQEGTENRTENSGADVPNDAPQE